MLPGINNQNAHAFLTEEITADYGVVGFIIGMIGAIVGLYFTDGGKKHLYSWSSIGIGFFVIIALFALYSAWKNRQRYRIWIAGAPAWMKTIQAGVILIFMSLVCYIGEGSIGEIVFFIVASFSTLGLFPLLRNDLGLVNFFIGGAIYTTVVKFNLGHWTWIVVAFCIGIVYLRNEFEQIVAIPAAAIEMRKDEDVELRIQGSQIGIGQLPN